MAYRRRYLSGQSATTVVIAEGAVTTDKIVDKAVTQPKIDDNAVTTEKIATSGVETSDIKDGDVKTVDLGNSAVTTPKIADGAVTTAKLEASIQGIARPLTPGVATVEIADLAVTEGKIAANAVAAAKIKAGAVDATKLAGGAVETAKIKDANVTGAKLAAGSVDNTKIIADAVRGTEIQDGAVSVNKIGTAAVETAKIKDFNVLADKLGVDSVETDKIVDDAVTEPKLDGAALANRHIESKNARIIDHIEEFGGIDISNKWVKTCDAGGLFFMDGADGFQIRTNPNNGDKAWIDWGTEKPFQLDVNLSVMNFFVSNRSNPVNRIVTFLGYWNDWNNFIMFYASDVVGATPNWIAECMVGGVPTLVDTLVAVTQAIQLMSIDCVSVNSVKFYIDGLEKAEITTNIPSAVPLGPRFDIEAKENVLKYFDLSYVSILGRRPAYS